jgi:hypothetical protein
MVPERMPVVDIEPTASGTRTERATTLVADGVQIVLETHSALGKIQEAELGLIALETHSGQANF